MGTYRARMPESDGHGQTPRSLPLILARELAANLATPMFLIDAEGTLVFYNEAAELMLGKTYTEMGPVTANDFGDMLQLENLDGEPLRKRDSPPGIAFMQREPAHSTLLATTLDGNRRARFEITAYPLFGRTGDMHGVLTVFWEATH
jgi:PAS domain-containing protein